MVSIDRYWIWTSGTSKQHGDAQRSSQNLHHRAGCQRPRRAGLQANVEQRVPPAFRRMVVRGQPIALGRCVLFVFGAGLCQLRTNELDTTTKAVLDVATNVALPLMRTAI